MKRGPEVPDVAQHEGKTPYAIARTRSRITEKEAPDPSGFSKRAVDGWYPCYRMTGQLPRHLPLTTRGSPSILHVHTRRRQGE